GTTALVLVGAIRDRVLVRATLLRAICISCCNVSALRHPTCCAPTPREASTFAWIRSSIRPPLPGSYSSTPGRRVWRHGFQICPGALKRCARHARDGLWPSSSRQSAGSGCCVSGPWIQIRRHQECPLNNGKGSRVGVGERAP